MSELIGDPLGLQPADAPSVFRGIAKYNYLVRSVLFGQESPEQRQVRIGMFGTDLNSGVMGQITEKRALIVKLEEFTPQQYAKLAEGRSLAGAYKAIAERLERERQELDTLNQGKLRLVKAYASPTRTPQQIFYPPKQKGYTCVPTALHEVGRRIAGKDWPFQSVEAIRSEFDQLTHGDWTNPTRIAEFVRYLGDRKRVPLLARSCLEPLTLVAGIQAGGMAVAKHQGWEHVYIVEDFGRKGGGDLQFVVGSTLGGVLDEEVSLEEVDRTYFKPQEINAVTVILPYKCSS